jgi:hypothetical protein
MCYLIFHVRLQAKGMLANVKTALFGRALNAAAHYCVFVRFVNRNSLLLVGVSIL